MHALPLTDVVMSKPLFRRSRPWSTHRTIDRRWRGNDSELRPRAWRGHAGGPGFIDEIKNQHSRLASWIHWRTREVGRADWELTPAGSEEQPETPQEATLRRYIDRIVLQECVTNAAQSTPALRGSFRRVMQKMATRDEYGSAFFEKTWWEDPTALGGLRLELYPVHQSTVGEFLEDARTGQLVSLRQQTQSALATIPAHKLYLFPFGGAEGEYEGWTRYRSLGLLWEVVKQSTHSYAMAQRREAGILTVREVESGTWDPAAIALVEEFLEQTEDGTAMSGRLPYGSAAEFLTTRASVSNPTELWRHFDATVDHMTEQHANSLGATSGTGARALGEVFVKKEESAWNAFLAELGQTFADNVFPDIRDVLGFPSTCRVPGLGVASSAAHTTGTELREAITLGIDKGLLLPGPKLAREYAENLGLGEEVIAEQVALLAARTAAPAPTPIPPAATPASVPAAPSREGGAGGTPPQAGSPREPGRVNAAEGTATPAGAAVPGELVLVDYDGKPLRYYRDLTPLERLVSWDDVKTRRTRIDALLEMKVEAAIEQHRRDLVTAIDDGTDEGLSEQDVDQLIRSIRQEFVERYREIVRKYVLEVARHGGKQEATFRERQNPLRVPDGYDAAAVDAELQRVLNRSWGQMNAIRRGIERASQQIAHRVEDDIVRGWGSTLTKTQAADVRPIQTAKGLTRDVKRLGNRAEAGGRMIDAVLGSRAVGLVAFRSQRTGIRDENLCGHCRRMDGTEWMLSTAAEVAAFSDDPMADTPDTDCDGETSCRCGHVLEYRKLSIEWKPVPTKWDSLDKILAVVLDQTGGSDGEQNSANLPSMGAPDAGLRGSKS